MKKIENYNRSNLENFIYHEADLLDQWKLDEWLELLDDNFIYQIPSNDSLDTTHRKSLFLVADDSNRIKERVHRLKDKNAHAEFPHSRTRRIITNVLVREVNKIDEKIIINLHANFITYRFKRGGDIRTYVGSYQYVITEFDENYKIMQKKVILDAYELGTMGLISFIL
jgi:p-cumate 2,3-dioxygenase beta subunit